jgi:hypothetical protein
MLNLLEMGKLTQGGMITREDFLSSLASSDFPIVTNNKQISFYNIPASFDIETTSIFSGQQEKLAWMYEWTFGIDGIVTYGRTWSEFEDFYYSVSQILELSKYLKLVVYVQNLPYEFQFIRKRFSWDNVFCMEERKPIYALSEDGFEFRCSFRLSGKSLEKIGEDLQKYKCKKMVGDLDYTKTRTQKTPLTDVELGYCENDVRVVMCYIQECIENSGDITKIPLTKTGYVRQLCRKACYSGSKYKWRSYRDLMKSLVLCPEEYKQLKRAFAGGFTHANAMYSNKTIHNVNSRDETSAYPYVMLSEQFPMSASEEYTPNSKEDFEKQLNIYCCLFDIEFYGLESKTIIEHPLSFSKCMKVTGYTLDNGRIAQAEYCSTTITEQDYFILKKFYSWKDSNVANFRRYMKNYLPKDFVMAILQLYIDKTQLKGIDGKEVEYMLSKNNLNACFGMTVTDIVREVISYVDDNYDVKSPELDEAIQHYNDSKNRFLFYPWGVWVTAYARRNLFLAIYECGEDYIYSDTDSVKIVNEEKHIKFFESYNEEVKAKLKKSAEYWGIDPFMFAPKNKKGEEKQLGVWDDEGVYKRFKTLGAKRYIVEKPNVIEVDGKKYDISITVSGVNKNRAVPFLVENYKDPFRAFTEGLIIPEEYTGKNTLTYIDYETRGTVKDYLGIEGEFHELSSIHMCGCEYNMSITSAYLDFIMKIQEKLE